MFAEAFEKYNPGQVEKALSVLNPMMEAVHFEPASTSIMGLDLEFYPGFALLDIMDHHCIPPSSRTALYCEKSPEKSVVLDYTHDQLYALGESMPIALSMDNVEDYVRFFFSYVRGKHGRFVIVEHVDDVRWKEDLPPETRKTIGKAITPIALEECDDKGHFVLQACMVFKNALFKGLVRVTQKGVVTIENEELLAEDLPILDDLLGF